MDLKETRRGQSEPAPPALFLWISQDNLSWSGYTGETRGQQSIYISSSFIDSLSVLHLGHNFHKVQAVKKRAITRMTLTGTEKKQKTLGWTTTHYVPIDILCAALNEQGKYTNEPLVDILLICFEHNFFF